MPEVFVSHPSDKLEHYYGDRAIAALRAIACSAAVARAP